tara:strand:- start:79 stop:552 length:474 start_codon:yes stop_codon:yes gene_type:complete
MKILQKTVSESALENQVYQIFPGDLNTNGTLFGGRLMALMDEVAFMIAVSHSHQVCVTACVDRINFIKPATLGDKIVISGAVNKAWKTSLEVGLKVCKQDLKGGDKQQILKAYMVFVAIDKHNRPVAVPAIVPETDIEIKRYKEAEQRKVVRSTQRQ